VLAPTWLTDGLAVVMLAVAVYCASRLVIARVTHRATHYSFDAVHTVMGVAMAGMLTSHLEPTTPWIVVFVAAAAWFGLRAAGGVFSGRSTSIAPGSHLRHLMTSGAMIYMLAAVPTVAAASTPSSGGSTAMTMTTSGAGGSVRFPTVALLFGLFMVGYTIMVTDRASRTTSASQRQGSGIWAPRTVACCQVAMNITMGYMLVVLL
jgi:hypothetical protein